MFLDGLADQTDELIQILLQIKVILTSVVHFKYSMHDLKIENFYFSHRNSLKE